MIIKHNLGPSATRSHHLASARPWLYRRTIRSWNSEENLSEVLRKISAILILHSVLFSDLEATLLLLPFDYVQKLFALLIEYLSRFQSPELCVKCAVFLMKIHHGVLTSSHQYLNVVEQLRTRCMETVETLRVNVAEKVWTVKRWFRLEQRGIQPRWFEVNPPSDWRTKRCGSVRRRDGETRHEKTQEKQIVVGSDFDY